MIRIFILLVCALLAIQSSLAQGSTTLANLEAEKRSLLQDEKELRKELKDKQGFYQALDDKDAKINEFRRIRTDSIKYKQKLKDLEILFSSNSKTIKEFRPEATNAKNGISLLDTKKKRLEDTINSMKVQLGFSTSANSRDQAIIDAQRQLFDRFVQLHKQISTTKGRPEIGYKYINQYLTKNLQHLLTDTGRMDLTIAEEYVSIAKMAERNMPLSSDLEETINSTKAIKSIFQALSMASGLLEKEYSKDSNDICLKNLDSCLLLIKENNELINFEQKISRNRLLISNYCSVSKNFWKEVNTIASIPIKEIAKGKLDKVLPKIDIEYQYLRKQAIPILSDLTSAKIKSDKVLMVLEKNCPGSQK